MPLSAPMDGPRAAVPVPYDSTTVLATVPVRGDDATLVVAAIALTSCRWTDTTDVSVAVTTQDSPRPARTVVRLRIDDDVTVGDFLRAVGAAVRAGADGGGGEAGGQVDLVISSDHADLRSGTIHFTTDVPDAVPGFGADVSAAVRELGSRTGPLREVRCIAPNRRRILDGLAGPKVRAVSIETLFLEQVRRHPRRVAVRDANVELTYEQLAGAADEFAHVLRHAGVRLDDRVLVAIPRSVAEVVALLAIIRLGAAYAGFDDDAPVARAQLVIHKLAPAAAVVDATSARHPAMRALARVDAWSPGQHPRTDPGTGRLEPDDPDRPAYVAFTSGSTGEPKGVVVPHQAVTRLVLTPELRMRPGDRVMRMAPLAFDASTFEIWLSLLAGATLVVIPSGIQSVGNLEKFFIEQKLSIVGLPTSLFRLVAESRPKAFAGMRWVVTGGEVVPHETAARLLDLYPGLVITNGYGPTENTLFTTTHTVRAAGEIDGPLPIGRPISGTRVYVLDRDARLLPPGAVGELYAAGTGLAHGYLGDERETRNRFGCFSADTGERLYRTGDLVRVDPAGRVQFLGRADKQVKLNGHRIETEEISAALMRHPDVRDAVIVVSRRANRTVRLTAAVVVRSDVDTSPGTLREFLSQLLPTYMIPALWALIDELPLTRNGKLDEQAVVDLAVPATHTS